MVMPTITLLYIINIDGDSAQCLTCSTNFFQLLTLESWRTNLEQTLLKRRSTATNALQTTYPRQKRARQTEL